MASFSAPHLAGLLVLCAASFFASESAAQDAPPAAPGAPEDKLPPRPPLLEVTASEGLPFTRHIDFGVDAAFVFRFAENASVGTGANPSYEPALGFGVHGRIMLARYLGFTGYFVDSSHTVSLPSGSLGLQGQLDTAKLDTYAFGARLTPTYPINERLRVWLTAGFGWGRLELRRMEVTPPGQSSYVVRERADSFLEVPFGIGGSYDVIRNWLALDLESTVSIASDQQDESWASMQAVDASGRRVAVGPMPPISASFVQTLGFSLIL